VTASWHGGRPILRGGHESGGL